MPLPLPNNTLTACSRSGRRPGRLTVAVNVRHATEFTKLSVAILTAAWKVPLPLPSSTLTVSLLRLGTIRSSLPSPLTSATTTERGFEPVL